jgi:hypothetical protein
MDAARRSPRHCPRATNRNMEMQMNANITRAASALASLAMALLASPVSAGAAQVHKPNQVAVKVVPVYNPGIGTQRSKIYLLENRAPRNTNAAENFQDAFNISY